MVVVANGSRAEIITDSLALSPHEAQTAALRDPSAPLATFRGLRALLHSATLLLVLVLEPVSRRRHIYNIIIKSVSPSSDSSASFAHDHALDLPLQLLNILVVALENE